MCWTVVIDLSVLVLDTVSANMDWIHCSFTQSTTQEREGTVQMFILTMQKYLLRFFAITSNKTSICQSKSTECIAKHYLCSMLFCEVSYLHCFMKRKFIQGPQDMNCLKMELKTQWKQFTYLEQVLGPHYQTKRQFERHRKILLFRI